MSPRPFALVFVALLLSTASVGCNKYSCVEACDQYYGTEDNLDGYEQCRNLSRRPTDNDTPAQASENCVDACETALYNTKVDATSGSDDGRGNAVLESEQDSLDFIRCVVEKDYSPEVNDITCDGLGEGDDCPWFIW
jgi:hypothetical protein